MPYCRGRKSLLLHATLSKKPSLQAALHDPAEMLKQERVYPPGNFATLSLMMAQVNELFLHGR
jgi:hypothetical protein